MDKLQRNFIIEVEDQTGDMIRIEPPFSVDFDIFRNKMSSANTAKIRIYNLAEETRNRILKNPFVGKSRLVTLHAGYGINLPLILIGQNMQAYSVREGTNFVTTIESFDAGYAYSNAVYDGPTFPAGTPVQTIVETLIESLEPYGVGVGIISNLGDEKITRARSITGPTTEALRVITNDRFFVDNGLAFVLSDSNAIRGEVEIVNASTGLLGTPTRNETYLNFEMLFEPRLIIGQQLFVETQTARNYTGQYQVVSIHHKGMISSSVGGNVVTQVGCLAVDQDTVQALIGQG